VINHTGIVVSASGGIVRTIEGNSGDAVRSNAYGIGTPTIAGYGRPNWSIVAGSDNNVPTTDVTDNNVGDISNATVLATYTVQPGDTLYGIAAKTGVPFDEIVRINKIMNPNLIHVGEIFKLKDDEDAVPPPSSTPSVTDLTQVAQRVIRGEFGNGVIRTILLKQQGYDPDEVQRIVNKILLGG
jgi:LysM repeat protein